MSIDRRNFLKTLGIAGLTLTVGNTFGKKTNEKRDVTEFHALLFDATVCIGCRSCEKACAKANNLPEPKDEIVADIERKTSETSRGVINSHTTSKGEVFVRNQCMHCNEPACAAACLTKAMYKTHEGPVIWRGDKCMGCRYCMVSCPFDVPKFEYHSSNPKIEKCSMCYEKILRGEIPACAAACGDALIFGTRREMLAEAQKRIVDYPDDYYHKIYGEDVAGGTGLLYLSPVPFEELKLNTKLQNSSYPELSKGFLYSVPGIFVLLPPLLLGIHEATKSNLLKSDNNE